MPKPAEKPKAVTINFQLSDTERERVETYRDREKLRSYTAAIYKLAFERLEQLEKSVADSSS